MSPDEDLSRWQRRYERERRARREAESIAETVTRELYSAKGELELVNAALTSTNEELQAVNRSMRDFVAIASHDLRGPLTAILGYVDLMKRRGDVLTDEQKADFLDIIRNQGVHLARLVEDLLTVSKIEAGALDVHRDVVGLHQALREAIRDSSARSAQIELVSPDDLAALVDPDHLRRIVMNFVGNALKYGEPPVEVEARDAGEWIEIFVRDHGEGVSEEFRPRLFGRFARGGVTPHNGERSTGLGLSIVQGLAQANGGDVWYEPNLPHGSCFAVRLPRAAA